MICSMSLRTQTSSLELPSHGISVHTFQFQPTDRPIEDRISICSEIDRSILGVFDGHRGPWTAEHISKELPKRLLADPQKSREAVFMQLDEELMRDFQEAHIPKARGLSQRISGLLGGRSAVMEKVDAEHEARKREVAQRVLAGSTACIVRIAPGSIQAYNCGDSRAAIYDHENDAIYETIDHSSHSPSEVERVTAEHPGEPHIFTGGRLFGQQLATRGFGDAYYKLPSQGHRQAIDILSQYQKAKAVPLSTMYGSLFHDYKTPPYLTAQPEAIQTLPEGYKFGRSDGDIGIIATDGLWDMASSREVVDILREAPRKVGNLAEYLLDTIVSKRGGALPGDDTSIVLFVPTLPAAETGGDT